MDPRYTEEVAEHLKKQNELLWDAYRTMTHELHKLQVEEEMLMRKFFEVMSAHGSTKKKQSVDDLLDKLMKKKSENLKGSKEEQPRGSSSTDETTDEDE